MNERERPGWSLRGPEIFGLVLIGIGVLSFLDFSNIIQISVASLWPVILIGLGALILLQARRPSPAGVAGTDLPLTGPGGSPRSQPAAGGSSVRIPRDGIQQLEFDMGVGAGTFRMGGGATELLEATSQREDIVVRLDRSGPRTRLGLRQDTSWFPQAFRGGTEWHVRLPDDVPTAFSLNAGAGDFIIDLSTLRIVDARLTIGAAQARLLLPRPSGDVQVKVITGASSVSIQIPDGVEARVRSEGGLLRVDGRGETPNYATSRDRVTVSVSGGAASVRVL